MSRRLGRSIRSTLLATAATGLGVIGVVSPALAGPVVLTEAGSNNMFPLFQLWAPAYHAVNGNITISPAAGGSGLGIADATVGIVNIGASDAYLSPAEMRAASDLVNIPLSVSAVTVDYNVPGIAAHLKLSGKVLSGIYQGQITNWDNPAIAASNPGVKLPQLKIVPLHRSDSSGDTFLVSQYLSKSDPSGWGSKYGSSTTYPGPSTATSLGENGEGGMVTGCSSNPGCIAYIGISYLGKAAAAGLGEAALENSSGNYLLPTGSTISAEASYFAPRTPGNEAISLVDGPVPQGYPVVSYDYAIVTTIQPSAATASAIRIFLTWASSVTGGSSSRFLNQVGYQPLPPSVLFLSAAQLARIS